MEPPPPPPSVQQQQQQQQQKYSTHVVLQLSDEDVEINYRKPLGGGAFCMVYPVTLKQQKHVQQQQQQQDKDTEATEESFKEEKKNRDNDDDDDLKTNTDETVAPQTPVWALKKLRHHIAVPSDPNNPKLQQLAQMAANDLRHEANLLKDLSHPNIIQLYGISHNNNNNNNNNNNKENKKEELTKDKDDEEEDAKEHVEKDSSTTITTTTTTTIDPSFFIVITLLTDTLEKRMESSAWMSSRPFFFQSQQLSHDHIVVPRLQHIVLGIVQGMEYLHSHHIFYRDLKPDNIGFDSMDRVKIFDFGLSQRLKNNNNNNHDHDMCTGLDGTLRYLAPEVLMDHGKTPYHAFPVDVFAFALLLWQIVTGGRLPYEQEISSFSDTKPQLQGIRPPLTPFIASTDIHALLETSWAQNPNERPTFTEIRMTLEHIISKSLSSKQQQQQQKEKSSSSSSSSSPPLAANQNRPWNVDIMGNLNVATNYLLETIYPATTNTNTLTTNTTTNTTTSTTTTSDTPLVSK